MNKTDEFKEILKKNNLVIFEEYGDGLVEGLLSEAINSLKEAYNLAINDAANNAEADTFEDEDAVVGKFTGAVVNRESILQLKLK